MLVPLLKAWELLGSIGVGHTSSRGMSPGVRNSSATFGMPSAALHSDDSLSFRMGLRLACRFVRHDAPSLQDAVPASYMVGSAYGDCWVRSAGVGDLRHVRYHPAQQVLEECFF